MKSRTAILFVLSVLMIAAVAAVNTAVPVSAQEISYTKYSRVMLNIFDTEITLIGFAPSEEAFSKAADSTFALLESLDHLFDAYNEYDGLHNLYYLNRHAANEPVEVPQELFDLIDWCQKSWRSGMTDTNIAMGAVLTIWHEYRPAGLADPENAALPPMEDLAAASAHVDFDQVVLDQEKHTVFYSDPYLSLDIGAVAKGYAADAAKAMLSREMPSFLLSLGGNVYAGEPPRDGRANWAVGVQDPRAAGLNASVSGTDILDIIDASSLSVVTSGDYWRFYIVDGVRYHHIIDPSTLMPSQKMLSVTVLSESSLLADYLSTALFINSYEDGLQIVEALNGVEAMWVLPGGEIKASSGMANYARSLK